MVQIKKKTKTNITICHPNLKKKHWPKPKTKKGNNRISSKKKTIACPNPKTTKIGNSQCQNGNIVKIGEFFF